MGRPWQAEVWQPRPPNRPVPQPHDTAELAAARFWLILPLLSTAKPPWLTSWSSFRRRNRECWPLPR